MQVRRSMGRCVIAAASIGAVLFAGQLPTSGAVSAATPTSWLSTVNAYRQMSGLAPVTENTTWSAEGYAHSCYMLANGISHDEVPGNPGYTAGGDIAGNSGNVAVSSSTAATARNHIDLWMSGPFHAIGILRPQAGDERVRHLRRRIGQPHGTPEARSTCSAASTTRSPARPRRPSSRAAIPRSPWIASSPSLLTR